MNKKIKVRCRDCKHLKGYINELNSEGFGPVQYKCSENIKVFRFTKIHYCKSYHRKWWKFWAINNR